MIATFYNVEAPLIRRCVASMTNQVFNGAYEIILVDDASPDGTLSVLNEFSGLAGVRVFRSDRNLGPGGSRNWGVSKAKGKYVTFVDGDDFVSPYYLRALTQGLRQSGADYVAASHITVPYLQAKKAVSWQRDFEVRSLDQREYLLALCYERVTEAPWAKLAPRALYLEHPFPEGTYYEDVDVAGVHALVCHQFVVVKTPVYGYLMRPNSVVHKKAATYKQAVDFYNAICDFLEPILELPDTELQVASSYRACLELSRLHSVLSRVGDEPEKAARLDRRIIEVLGLYLQVVRHDTNAPRANVLRFRLLARCPRIYDRAFALYEAVSKSVVR